MGEPFRDGQELDPYHSGSTQSVTGGDYAEDAVPVAHAISDAGRDVGGNIVLGHISFFGTLRPSVANQVVVVLGLDDEVGGGDRNTSDVGIPESSYNHQAGQRKDEDSWRIS